MNDVNTCDLPTTRCIRSGLLKGGLIFIVFMVLDFAHFNNSFDKFKDSDRV